MTDDDVIDMILQLACDPATGDDELRRGISGVLARLAPEQRAAVRERARTLLLEHRQLE